MQDIAEIIRHHKMPDVLILTETKRLKPLTLRRDIHALYTAHSSTSPTGNGGVTALVTRKFTNISALEIRTNHNKNELSGYLLHIVIQPRFSPGLHVLGIYAPNDDAYKIHRPAIYSHLNRVIADRHPLDTLVSPKWDVNIILVGNEAGFTNLQLHLDEHALQTDMLQVLETINKKPIPSITDMGTYKHLRTRLNTYPNQLHECSAETSWISTPNKFKRLPAAVPPNPLPPITWGQKDMHALHLDFPALPCRFQWNDIIYTDGSLRGTKRRSTARNLINPPTNGKGVARSDAGSGIYVPAGKYSPDPVSICLDPAGVGCTNTVNRAELAPIHYVLQQQRETYPPHQSQGPYRNSRE